MKLRSIMVISLIATCLLLATATGALAYTLSLQATSDGNTPQTVFAAGSEIYVNIIVDNAAMIAGCAFTLNYSTDVLIAPETNADGTPVAADGVTSIFPFVYQTTPTHRENSSEAGKVYLSGAAINTTDGGAKYDSGEMVLFTVKFIVRPDAPLGIFNLSLTQTELFNEPAGWGNDVDDDGVYDPGDGDTKALAPVLVGAVDNTHSDWGNLEAAFPVLLGDGSNPFTTVTSADLTISECPWEPITGNQYTMIVAGTATADGFDLAVGDCIVAFGPGGDADVRAVAKIQTAGEYFLTIRGNQLSGEIIHFKIRRDSDKKILTSTNTVEFVSDGEVTTQLLEFTSSVPQTIPLIENWNWVSFNVLPEDTTLQGFFGANLDNLEQIKTQTTSMLNIGGNWIGDDPTIMSKISQFQMFKIKVKQGAAFDLTVSGQPLDPQAPIPLQLNWSWIAYSPDYCLTVQAGIDTVFTDINQVKSQTQSRLKINESTFIGDLEEMCPGKGYTIKMLAPGTLIYPVQP